MYLGLPNASVESNGIISGNLPDAAQIVPYQVTEGEVEELVNRFIYMYTIYRQRFEYISFGCDFSRV